MSLKLLRAAVTLFGICLLWELVVWASDVPPYILPGPLRVFAAIGEHAGALARHAWVTFTEILLGLAAGSLAGIASALSLAYFRPARRWLLPLLIASQAVPVFALAPLLVLWLGYGMVSKVGMATIIIYFPVTVNFFDGLRRTEPGWLDLAQTMGAEQLDEEECRARGDAGHRDPLAPELLVRVDRRRGHESERGIGAPGDHRDRRALVDAPHDGIGGGAAEVRRARDDRLDGVRTAGHFDEVGLEVVLHEEALRIGHHHVPVRRGLEPAPDRDLDRRHGRGLHRSAAGRAARLRRRGARCGAADDADAQRDEERRGHDPWPGKRLHSHRTPSMLRLWMDRHTARA